MECLLAREGLEAASMSAIAREAGMSKRTLYQVFSSRAELFQALVRRIRTTFVRPLSAAERELPLEQRLLRLMAPDVSRIDHEVQLAVLRAVVAEASQHPELAQAFIREGPQEARRVIRDELARAAARGEIRLGDVDATARLLCDMAYENPIDRMADPKLLAPSPARITARVELAVRIFLRGVGTTTEANEPGPM